MVRNFVLSKASSHAQNSLARGRWRHKPEGAFNIYFFIKGGMGAGKPIFQVLAMAIGEL